MRIAWVDTLVDYPIYGDLTGSPLFNNSHDISLPLAYVYLRSYLATKHPDVELEYHPRRLYAAEGRSTEVETLVEDSDVVMTSCSAADSIDARTILAKAKAMNKTTIIGGIYPRFSHSDILNWGTADYIVTGEGEAALDSVIRVLKEGSTPPTRWKGVVTPVNPSHTDADLLDLASLPQPDYSCLPLRDFQKYMRTAYILATRGCPAPCHFCTSARLYGYSYRTRQIQSVVQEIKDLYAEGFHSITLADDTIAVTHDWAVDLFKALADANPGVRLKVRSRADELSEALLDVMVDAGVEVVQFGVESINLSTREMMYKRLTQRGIEDAFDAILRRPQLKANPLYMLAYPGESWSDLELNADFICRMGTDPKVITYVSFTTPYPGTPFARSIVNKQGILLTRDLRFFTNKFPLFIPSSLLDVTAEAALRRLLDVYDRIANVVNVSHSTQFPIPSEFFSELNFERA